MSWTMSHHAEDPGIETLTTTMLSPAADPAIAKMIQNPSAAETQRKPLVTVTAMTEIEATAAVLHETTTS